MKNSVSQSDIYTVINQSILTEADRKVLISLYEPIIGSNALSLYFTLWQDLDKCEVISNDLNHKHLMVILKLPLGDIVEARRALEAVGLLKSFVKENDNLSEYLYELYSPLSAYEFFNHPVLSILLLNNIGEIEYRILTEYYKKINIPKKDYVEITSTMNETFRSVTPYEKENEEIRRKSKLNINISNLIDFDLLTESLPKGLLNDKTFNKRNKELINQLAFVYNVDSIKMAEFIRLVIDNVGIIDRDKLINIVRRNYEFNNNGSLPTIVYRTQPDYLKTTTSGLSNRDKMIQVFENTKPYDYLKFKNNNNKPTARDLKLLEHLAIDQGLSPGVINVLIDYAIRMNDGKLNQNYLDTIASSWNRKGVKTVPQAMDAVTKNFKKDTKTVVKAAPKKVIPVPVWMDKDNKREEISDQELEELEREMEIFN
jgi:replication initiation and membrane attachment protein